LESQLNHKRPPFSALKAVGFVLVSIVLTIALSSCAASEEAREDRPERRPEPSGLNINDDSEEVESVQLHAGSGETSLPIVQLGSGLTIRLAFDLMTTRGRPLTVYFYHADREWKRDLIPSEYLSIFHRDDLIDYRSSGATFVDYVHYEYEFPNSTIDFRMSGNYILRVSERGNEDEILFERPFFVSEQSTPMDMRLDNVLVAGRQFSSIQPIVRFTPPDLTTNIFDYSVCFLRNSWYELSRCVENPSLDVRPDIQYYLEPRDSFGPRSSSYYLNLSDVRPGGRVERIDQNAIPWSVTMEPDYSNLGASGISPFLNGQSVIREGVRSVGDPDHAAEYVAVTLRLVPPNEQRAAGRIFVAGSFSNWVVQERNELFWNAGSGWYEGEVLMKQGQHEYRYFSNDSSLQQRLDGGMPQVQNMFTTFIYLDDISIQSDRLIATQGIISR